MFLNDEVRAGCPKLRHTTLLYSMVEPEPSGGGRGGGGVVEAAAGGRGRGAHQHLPGGGGYIYNAISFSLLDIFFQGCQI